MAQASVKSSSHCGSCSRLSLRRHVAPSEVGATCLKPIGRSPRAGWRCSETTICGGQSGSQIFRISSPSNLLPERSAHLELTLSDNSKPDRKTGQIGFVQDLHVDDCEPSQCHQNCEYCFVFMF